MDNNQMNNMIPAENSYATLSAKDVCIDELLKIGISKNASDLHISVGLAPIMRIDGKLYPIDCEVLNADDVKRIILDMLTGEQKENFDRTHELDFAYSLPDISRFRCNLYWERGNIAAALRTIPNIIPTLEQLFMPPVLSDLSKKNSGLILVTGPTGCGKSTTIAAMLDCINRESGCHIVTIEDPIEYLHTHKKSMIHQREMKSDTYSFSTALRAVLREDPDVLLIGEMRDLETIAAAVTLAETGHLVFATLHTRNAPQTIDRIIDAFPPHQQKQIIVQLSNTLEAVIAQQLVPRMGGGRIAMVEVLIATSGIRNLIRESKTYQLYSAMETGAQYGMRTMDKVLVNAYKDGIISYKDAISRSIDTENFMRLLKT